MFPLNLLTNDADILYILLIHTSHIPTLEAISRSKGEAKAMTWKSLKSSIWLLNNLI